MMSHALCGRGGKKIRKGETDGRKEKRGQGRLNRDATPYTTSVQIKPKLLVRPI